MWVHFHLLSSLLGFFPWILRMGWNHHLTEYKFGMPYIPMNIFYYLWLWMSSQCAQSPCSMLRFEFHYIHLSIGSLSGAADSDIPLLSVSSYPHTPLVYLMFTNTHTIQIQHSTLSESIHQGSLLKMQNASYKDTRWYSGEWLTLFQPRQFSYCKYKKNGGLPKISHSTHTHQGRERERSLQRNCRSNPHFSITVVELCAIKDNLHTLIWH